MDAPKLHPGSGQHRRRMDLERTPRPNPHAHHDRSLRRRRMDTRLPAMLRVSHRHSPLCPSTLSFISPSNQRKPKQQHPPRRLDRTTRSKPLHRLRRQQPTSRQHPTQLGSRPISLRQTSRPSARNNRYDARRLPQGWVCGYL